MATATVSCPIAEIGQAAGLIWQTLDEDGPQTIVKLVKKIDAPRDVAMQAIGWLAREDKIDIEETRRSKIVTLH